MIDASEIEAGEIHTPRVVTARRRAVAAAVLGSSIVGIVVMASQQVHPDIAVFLAASFILLAGFAVPLGILIDDDLHRVAPFALSGLLALALLGRVAPTNLVAVALLLDHPALFCSVALLVIHRAYLPFSNRWIDGAASISFAFALLAVCSWGGLVTVADPHGNFSSSTKADEGPARIDSATGGLGGGCSSSEGFLRSGSGLTLREEYLGDACQGSPAFHSRPVDNATPRTRRTFGDAVVCTPAASGNGNLIIEFDPVTLAGAEDASTLCD